MEEGRKRGQESDNEAHHRQAGVERTVAGVVERCMLGVVISITNAVFPNFITVRGMGGRIKYSI